MQETSRATEVNHAAGKAEQISIMVDPDLHPLPITPNDPLSIFSNKMKFGSMDPKQAHQKFSTPSTNEGN